MAYCYILKRVCPTENIDCIDCKTYQIHRSSLNPSFRFCDCSGCVNERRHYKGYVSLKEYEIDKLMRNSQRAYGVLKWGLQQELESI